MFSRCGPRRHIPLLPVGEIVNPVHDADGDRLSADRAEPLAPLSLGRAPPDAAFAVAIVVVFSLCGKKLDREEKLLWIMAFEAVDKIFISGLAVEDVCLARDLARRVSIGIGDQRDSVEGGKTPVHRRVRREARLDSINVGALFFEAL